VRRMPRRQHKHSPVRRRELSLTPSAPRRDAPPLARASLLYPMHGTPATLTSSARQCRLHRARPLVLPRSTKEEATRDWGDEGRGIGRSRLKSACSPTRPLLRTTRSIEEQLALRDNARVHPCARRRPYPRPLHPSSPWCSLSGTLQHSCFWSREILSAGGIAGKAARQTTPAKASPSCPRPAAVKGRTRNPHWYKKLPQTQPRRATQRIEGWLTGRPRLSSSGADLSNRVTKKVLRF